jgi:hypothetical protein
MIGARGTPARGILAETGTWDRSLAGKSVRAPIQTRAEREAVPLRRKALSLRQSPKLNVAALERSDNVADSHAFAVLKRGYPCRVVIVQETEMRPAPTGPPVKDCFSGAALPSEHLLGHKTAFRLSHPLHHTHEIETYAHA